jgi:hypothetical protein
MPCIDIRFDSNSMECCNFCYAAVLLILLILFMRNQRGWLHIHILLFMVYYLPAVKKIYSKDRARQGNPCGFMRIAS